MTSRYNILLISIVELDIGLVEDVHWNEEAFDLLVLEPQTKELVKAVVLNQLNAEESTDVIHGKGNGLFILLHGYKRPLKKISTVGWLLTCCAVVLELARHSQLRGTLS